METKIDWEKIWSKFDEWISPRTGLSLPEDQQRKIQRLVNAQVRELVKWRFLNQRRKI